MIKKKRKPTRRKPKNNEARRFRITLILEIAGLIMALLAVIATIWAVWPPYQRRQLVCSLPFSRFKVILHKDSDFYWEVPKRFFLTSMNWEPGTSPGERISGDFSYLVIREGESGSSEPGHVPTTWLFRIGDFLTHAEKIEKHDGQSYVVLTWTKDTEIPLGEARQELIQQVQALPGEKLLPASPIILSIDGYQCNQLLFRFQDDHVGSVKVLYFQFNGPSDYYELGFYAKEDSFSEFASEFNYIVEHFRFLD